MPATAKKKGKGKAKGKIKTIVVPTVVVKKVADANAENENNKDTGHIPVMDTDDIEKPTTIVHMTVSREPSRTADEPSRTIAEGEPSRAVAFGEPLHNKVMRAMQLLNAYKDVCTVFYLEALNSREMRGVLPCIKNALDSIQICNLCIYFIHNQSAHLRNMLGFTCHVLRDTVAQCNVPQGLAFDSDLGETFQTCMKLAQELGDCLQDMKDSL